MSIEAVARSAEVLIGIGFLILIHELGHFLMAKKIGVRVEAFSLGFGPHWGWKYGETEYRLSLIPLGGYVKLSGESALEGTTGDPREFMSKSVGQRAAVFAAGVVMNALFAFLMFIFAFRVGVPFSPAEVGDVEVAWPAWEAGIRHGDRILAINDVPMNDFEDISTTIALSDDREGLRFKIERDGKQQTLTIYPRHDPKHGFQRTGIFPPETTIVDSILSIDGKSPARDAGIHPGDRILSINGKPIHQWDDLRKIVSESPKKPLKIVLERKTRTGLRRIETTATPAPLSRPMIGISCGTNEIKSVQRGSAADRLGVRKGDRIVALNGQPIGFRSDIIRMADDRAIKTLKVRRGSKTITLVPPGKERITVKDFLLGAVPRLGLVIDTVEKGYPAEQVGLKRGDRMLAVGDRELKSWDDLVDAVQSNGTRATEIRWQRGNEQFVADVTPVAYSSNTTGWLGITAAPKLIVRRYSLLGSCSIGCRKAIISLKQIYLTFRGFATRRLSTKNVGGIILIAEASYRSAKRGVGRLLYFLGIISMNLAALNALPIPVLDGGHLLFCLAEKLKGKPLGERWVAAANYVGLTFVLLLVFYVTKNDILRLLER